MANGEGNRLPILDSRYWIFDSLTRAEISEFGFRISDVSPAELLTMNPNDLLLCRIAHRASRIAHRASRI